MPNPPPRPSPDAADVCAELRAAAAQVDADLAHFGKVHIQTGTRCEAVCLAAAKEIERIRKVEAGACQLAEGYRTERDSLRALVAGGEWVSVEDATPIDDVLVLVHTDRFNDGVGRFENGGKWSHVGGNPSDVVTHWRPLPAPPPVASEGGGA